MCHGMMIETDAAAPRGRASIGRLCGEPELGDLLRDPIAGALMAADRVDSSEIYALLRRVRRPAASGDSAG